MSPTFERTRNKVTYLMQFQIPIYEILNSTEIRTRSLVNVCRVSNSIYHGTFFRPNRRWDVETFLNRAYLFCELFCDKTFGVF